MFLTLGYLVIFLYERYTEWNKRMRYLNIFRQHSRYASVVIRKSFPNYPRVGMELVEENTAGWVESVVLQDSKQQVLTVSPQMCVNLRKWTSYLDQQNYPSLPVTPDPGKCYVLFEVSQPQDDQDFLEKSFSVPTGKRVKVVDYAKPIAWRAGEPFGIVAECSPDNLAHLAVAFAEGTVLLGDMLELREMMTISLEGHAANLLRLDSQSDRFSLASPTVHATPEKSRHWDPSLETLSDAGLEDHSLIGGSNESLASSTPNFERLLDIASQCSDADRLENENAFEDDYPPEGGAGEALSPSIEDIAPEVMTPARRRATNSAKPPNVVIYCGKKDSARQFENLKQTMQQCLNPDKYTIYHLRHDQVLGTPWMENSVLLLVCSEKAYDGVDEAFLRYFQQGGTVVSFACTFDGLFGLGKVQTSASASVLSLNYGKWNDVSVICGRYAFSDCDTHLDSVSLTKLGKDLKTGQVVMVEACHEESGGVAILSQASLDKDPTEMAISPEVFSMLKQANQSRFNILRDLYSRLGLDSSAGELPALTPCILMSVEQEQKTRLLQSVSPRLEDGWLRTKSISLRFINSLSETEETTSADKLPVICDSTPLEHPTRFKLDVYRENLQAKKLGQVVFYTEVIPTTMNMFEGLMFSTPADLGLIAVATRQTSGKGRGGNAWLSPPGCAMFTLHVRVPLHSMLGQRVAYLQHIASLAVVEAVRGLPGYQDIDLRLKWPNDIYFGGTMKLGGVLINSSIMGDVIHANIGCGFNVSNKDPTICINDLVHQYNRACRASLQPFVMEQLIGRTVTQIEDLIGQFQRQGKDWFLEQYYSRWLHGGATVRLAGDTRQSEILGLDDHGYLLIQSPGGATPTSVQPDGNTYDMMQGLIRPK